MFFFPGDSEGEQAERLEENITDSEEPEKEVKSVLKTKRLEDTESPHHADEPDGEENPDSEGRSAEDIESVPQDSQNGHEEKSHSEDKEADEEKSHSEDKEADEEKSHLEDEEADESSSALKEVSNEEGKSDSEGGQETNGSSPTKQEEPQRESLDPSDENDAEISDDEPLVFTFTLCV